jgi:T-complex protein 1 subunit alpha
VTTFADMEGEEAFDSSLLGHADEVVEERIADDDVVMVKGTKNTSAVSSCLALVLFPLPFMQKVIA